MWFWEYLKKQEPSKEYEDSKKRISMLHEAEGSMSYINQMFRLEDGMGEMQIEYVKGEHMQGETAELFDCRGEKSGEIVIREIFVGEDENPDIRSESGEKGKIVFSYEEPKENDFWKSQYLKSKSSKKIRKIKKTVDICLIGMVI